LLEEPKKILLKVSFFLLFLNFFYGKICLKVGEIYDV